MWRNIGGVLVNVDRLCYVDFEEEEDGAKATLHFTDYSETLSFDSDSIERLRSTFERLLGITNDNKKRLHSEESTTPPGSPPG